MHVTVNLLHRPKLKRPWVVRWWGDPHPKTGKQKRYGKAFRYRHHAKEFQVAKEAALNRGEPRDPVEVTLDEVIADFTEARLSRLSYASNEGYTNTFDQALAYFGPKRRVRTITRRDAEAFIATRQRRDGRPGGLATWSIARHLIHCRALFAAALAWRYVDENPFRADGATGPSPLRLNPKGKPWHHLTPDEFMHLIEVIPTVQRRVVCWLMYGCGLRPGEAYNVMVSNIDLESRRIHIVNRAGTDEIPPFTIKAEGQSTASKERSVPIPKAAMPDITEAMKQAFKSGRFLVLTPERFQSVKRYWKLCRAGKPWARHVWRPWQNRDMINNTLRDTTKFLRLAGMELSAPFNLHAFRKAFAQNHADAGTPPRTLAKLLGHANTRVTMQFYNRVTDANEREAGKAMDRLLRVKGRSANAG